LRIEPSRTLEERKIVPDDVLACRTAAYPSLGADVDWEDIPGDSLLEKKAHLGGFGHPDVALFRRQKVLAERTKRELAELGTSRQVERLLTAVHGKQVEHLNNVCAEHGGSSGSGPKVLNRVRLDLPSLLMMFSPLSSDVDEQFCLGILWQETDACSVWWHWPSFKAENGAI